ncbi:MAG: hypothetical protein AB8B74_09150 [Crocinitomicaceae bacterium]
MDKRFKNIENELKFKPNKAEMNSLFSEFDDLMLDNAFVEANKITQFPYSPTYWSNFKNQESELIQDSNFSEAAKNFNTTYNPKFWNQAQEVLATEGLHYQYKSVYWNEAEKLLKKADKNAFFKRWMITAASLVIIGLVSSALLRSNDISSSEPDLISKNLTIEKLIFSKHNRFNFNNYSNTKNAPSLSENEQIAAYTISKSKTIDLKVRSNSNNINSISNNSIPGKSDNITKSTIALNKEPNSNQDLKSSESTEPINLKTPEPGILADPFVKISSIRTNSNEVNKISIAPQSNIPQQFSTGKPSVLLSVGVRPKAPTNPLQLAILFQSGIGNSINIQNISHRASFDLELEYSLKNINFSFVSGLDYENLDNYTDHHDLVDYHRSGRVMHSWYTYEFKNIIKWQNALLFGYQFSNRFNLKTGLSIDNYVGSKVKMSESTDQDLSKNSYLWSRNEIFNDFDFQIIGRVEYQILPNFRIIASTEIGLMDKISKDLTKPFKNKNFSLGIKYLPFRK